jgi:Cdc6-like AAA superfamily ATPase
MSSLLEAIKNYHTTFLGRNQEGKTWEMCRLIDLIKEDKSLKIVIYNTQKHKKVRQLGINVNNIEHFKHSFARNQVTVFNPQINFHNFEQDEDLDVMLQYIFNVQDKLMYKREQKRIIVVVDEIDNFCDKHNISKTMKIILKRGTEPYKIRLWSLTHNIQHTNNVVFSQSKNAFVFTLGEYDYNFARKNHFNKLPKIQNLEQYSYYFVNQFMLKKIIKKVTV